MKRLLLIIFLVGWGSVGAQQNNPIEFLKGAVLDTLTTSEINALPAKAKVKGAIYYDRTKGNPVVSNGITFVDFGGPGTSYTAGTGLDLSGSEFSVVDAELNPSWANVTGKPANLDTDSTDDVTLTGNQTIDGVKEFINTVVHDMPVGSPLDTWANSTNTNSMTTRFSNGGDYFNLDPSGTGNSVAYSFLSETWIFPANHYFATPTTDSQAATKAYVDANSGSVGGIVAAGSFALVDNTDDYVIPHGLAYTPAITRISITSSGNSINDEPAIASVDGTNITFSFSPGRITTGVTSGGFYMSWKVFGSDNATPMTGDEIESSLDTELANTRWKVVEVPSGGTAGQVLKKIDGTDYNVEWDDETGGGTDDQTALEVPYTPSGTYPAYVLGSNLASTDLDQAIKELHNEKVDEVVLQGGAISVRARSTVRGTLNLRNMTLTDTSFDGNMSGLTTLLELANAFDDFSGSLSTDQSNRLANTNNIVRTFYTTEDVTTTVANQEVQSGGDIGSKVINTIAGATTATAELVNANATKIDTYSFDVLDAGGQWDITCTNGFVADGFTGDTVRLDGIGSVDFVETGVNTGIFQVTPGANVSYVTTASLIVPSLNDANTVLYIDAREFAASSNGASVSPTDQTSNGTSITSFNITKGEDSDGDPTFSFNGTSSRMSLGNNFNFTAGVAQTISIFISADGFGTGTRFAKRDDSSGGSNDHFAIYGGYYYMGANEGNPNFVSTANVLITLTKTAGDVWYIYENGTQRATGAWTNETSTVDLLIGAQVNGGAFSDWASGSFEVLYVTNDYTTVAEAGTRATEINTRP